MKTEILGLRMSVKSLPSKSEAVQLSIKEEVLRVTDLVLKENARLKTENDTLRNALKEFADEKNWLRDEEYRSHEWQGNADNPWVFAQAALKETL